MGQKGSVVLKKEWVVVLLSILITFLWGSCYPAVKLCFDYFNISDTDSFSKILQAGIRFVIAGGISLAITGMLHGRLKRPTRGSVLSILALGMIMTTVQYIFFYIGYAHTSGVRCSILYSTSSFISVFLSHFVYTDDRIDLKKLLGCLAGFAGVAVMNINTGESGYEGFSFLGDGFILLAAASFGAGALISKSATKAHDALEVSSYQMLFGGVLLCIIGALGGGTFKNVTINGILSVVYLSVVSAITFTLYTAILEYHKVGKLAVYNFLIPVFGVILSAVFLKEQVLPIHFVALLLVCTGIFVVNFQPVSFYNKHVTARR